MSLTPTATFRTLYVRHARPRHMVKISMHSAFLAYRYFSTAHHTLKLPRRQQQLVSIRADILNTRTPVHMQHADRHTRTHTKKLFEFEPKFAPATDTVSAATPAADRSFERVTAYKLPSHTCATSASTSTATGNTPPWIRDTLARLQRRPRAPMLLVSLSGLRMRPAWAAKQGRFLQRGRGSLLKVRQGCD
jgi:hypothetical protein